MIRDDIKNDFPLLKADPSLVYLDSSATMQRPRCVIDAERVFNETLNANPLRGLYKLSQKATDAYEDAREKVAGFIGAASTEEIVFTRNATESLNLVAYSFGETLSEGDEILITVMEHHSDIVPWQMLARRKGLVLRYVECDRDGVITPEAFENALTDRTKIAAAVHVSNVLGVKNDIAAFARAAHRAGAVFVCDGAQSVPHMPVDVRELDVDFLSFSGHKMGAPFGIGVLYGKKELMEKIPPFLTGGEMIDIVGRTESTWAELPHKFEAGTVNASGAYALGAAIDYYTNIGFENIVKREEILGKALYEALSSVNGVHILGPSDPLSHHGICSFTLEGVHPHDIAQILDSDGICIRAGHHCAQVLHSHLGVPSTARASIAFYNTLDDIERLKDSLSTVRRRMGYGE